MNADFCCGLDDVWPEAAPFPDLQDGVRDADYASECRMAEGANFDVADDAAANMAADEQTRVLRYILELCLDRPCPDCKSEVVDKPQDDLRQCRACGYLWGFDDTQTLEQFVQEFGRMEPCHVCGNDSLNDFQVVTNHGGQELICLRCQTTQDTRPMTEDTTGDKDVNAEVGGGRYDLDATPLNGRLAPNLSCPNCPDVTYDFFEKEFDQDELVRAVCLACNHVVFSKAARDTANTTRGAHQNGGLRGRLREQLYPPVRKALRCLTVKPLELALRTMETYSTAVAENEEFEPRLQDMVAQEMPKMGEQVGWTIGTTMGNFVLKSEPGTAACGTVGAIVGKGICDMMSNAMVQPWRRP